MSREREHHAKNTDDEANEQTFEIVVVHAKDGERQRAAQAAAAEGAEAVFESVADVGGWAGGTQYVRVGPPQRPWWYWPGVISLSAVMFVLALAVIVILIPVAIIILLFMLIRAWIRGFFPRRPRGSGATLRHNVRVVGRAGQH